MATKELDRWLLKQNYYPEPTLTEQGRRAFAKAVEETTVRAANTSAKTTESIKAVVCGCGHKAERVGAQDYCDVYVCKDGHINRFVVGKGERTPWTEE